MKQLSLKALCLNFLIVMPLIAAEPVATEPETKQIYLSEIELQEIFSNPNRSYVYVGKEISDIANVITEISKLEDDQNSPVWGLASHIEKGFVIGNYDAVAQALEQAEMILKKHADELGADKAAALSESLNNIITQVMEDRLSLDAEILSFIKDKVKVTEPDATRSGLRLLVVNERMNVHGKSKFFKDVTFTHDVKIKKNLTVEGSLSVADQVIGCDLTVGCNVSLNDSVSPAIGNIIKNGIPFIHNYPGIVGNNTFVGDNAGNFIMTGTENTGFGVGALTDNTVGSSNTAVGYLALNINTASNNTAVGQAALTSNITGTGNTAIGQAALAANTTGVTNTAVGQAALAANTIGIANTAVGQGALTTNTTGVSNTAVGNDALFSNTIGIDNTAIGEFALESNTIGSGNTAIGEGALSGCTTGSDNIAIGTGVAGTLVTGSNNIYIGTDAATAGESGVTRIANIYATTTGSVTTLPVIVDATGQLGTTASTRRVKHDIADMNDDSAAIYNLRPVSFVYNNDASGTKQYGLVAEEVDAVFSGLVVYDADGQPQTVQYHVLPALMLNELKKLAARVAVLEARA